MVTTAPYGSWASPFTAQLLTERTVRLSDLRVEGDDLWWVEGRPAEAGRQVVVRMTSDGTVADTLPDGFSARTTVHEYGGDTFTLAGGRLVFSNHEDQRLWLLEDGRPAWPERNAPRPLTPPPPAPGAWRYADARPVPGTDWLVCVRERHNGTTAAEVENDLVAVALAGGDPVVLVTSGDFYAAPRPSPDGARLAWVTWDHPDMPWDATELWVADLDAGSGGAPVVTGARRVAGSPDAPESVSQPRWSPDGRLHWLSDRTGWWNLYADGVALAPRGAEFGGPDWVFGQSTYGFTPDGRLVATWTEDGASHLGVLDPATGALDEVATPFTRFDSVAVRGDEVVAIAASPTDAAAVVAIPLGGGPHRVLRPSREAAVDPAWVSRPQAIDFPTTGGRRAFAYWYPPTSPDHEAPAGEVPPLVVLSHGGPTASASPALNLAVQFWTSRGLGVVDVDYGGSSGHGRAYRRALDGAWGVVDVEDCVAAARHLADRGLVDRARLVIRGGSAGGYTTLCALTFTDVFAAGASLYGVGDLEALATDTHKFESRYLDRLVGPWPEAADVYKARSPVHHADRLACPVIVLQGLEDRVVPPAQAEVLVAALRSKGLPVAYVTFPGEQHGFRKAETIRRAAEAELSFYGQVLGFEPAGATEAVEVENLRTGPSAGQGS